MSATVTGHLLVGAIVRESEFWTHTGSVRRCHRSHTFTTDYCGQCGGPGKMVALREPAPMLERFAGLLKRTPEEVWNTELEVGMIGVSRVAAIIPADGTAPHLLAVCVADAGYSGNGRGRVCSVDFAALLAAHDRVTDLLTQLGIARPVQVYPVVYYS